MVETRRLRKGLPKGTQSREYNTALRRESQMIRTSSHVAQSECSLIICQLIGGCQAHLARQLISPWKEEPLGVCWLTGKCLLREEGRASRKELSLGTRILSRSCF